MIPTVKQDGLELIGDDFVFQQDGSRVHTSKISLKSIQENSISIIEPNCWLTNSPYLNPMDYFFWNEVSSRLKQKKISNREELIDAIKRTVQEIHLKMIQDAIDQFRPRVHVVEKNCGE